MSIQNPEHKCLLQIYWASLVAQLVKNPPAMQETAVRFLGEEGSLEKGMATHASILAWSIPWTGRSMGSQRVGHDRATFTFTFFLILVGHVPSILSTFVFFCSFF